MYPPPSRPAIGLSLGNPRASRCLNVFVVFFWYTVWYLMLALFRAWFVADIYVPVTRHPALYPKAHPSGADIPVARHNEQALEICSALEDILLHGIRPPTTFMADPTQEEG